LTSVIQHPAAYETTTASATSFTHQRTLSAVVASFPPDQLTFAPEDELEGVPISMLPDEVIILILQELARVRDVASIERFAAVNRKARVISVDSDVWRNLVLSTYIPPQIPETLSFSDVLGQYAEDYRRTYIEHPRIRFDGVYIAVCHYVRPGQSESGWANVTHLITYHRYLRFFPDGTVLSLLDQNHPPAEIVQLMILTTKLKGYYKGTWRLDGTTVEIRDLADLGGGFGYGFEMVLSLKSKPLGRWNRLTIEEYSSVNLSTGDTATLGLKHERPFWFSKVLSYEV